jgi:hypothetical protein
MRLLRTLVAVPIACAVLGAGIYSFPGPVKSQELIGRSVSLGGRQLQCNNAPIMVDRTLPSEGAADDESLILNPDMLKDQPEIVRIFIFKHECGHLTVGDSELAADCFAVRQGVREQWLDRKGLNQVCQSFGGDPETDTHPSGARRCRNLDKCYAEALAEQQASAPARALVSSSKMPSNKSSATEALSPAQTIEVLPAHTAVSAWRCTAAGCR